jgi:hypothetical protein
MKNFWCAPREENSKKEKKKKEFDKDGVGVDNMAR